MNFSVAVENLTKVVENLRYKHSTAETLHSNSRRPGTCPTGGPHRRGASSSGDSTPRQFSSISIHGEEILRFELRKIGQNLLLRRSA